MNHHDAELARTARLHPIADVAARLGVPAGAVLPYGHHKAKIEPKFSASLAGQENGKLILVTAITPTGTGEGKTTVAIGLGDGLAHTGRKAVVCLREPSLGPCFGQKGGATGAGRAQIAPREEINLHFTGDFHAVGAANNLLASVIDDHLYRGCTPAIDPERVSWRRAVDISDRALREIEIGLGDGNGVKRRDGFDIVPASEVMAVLCLARDRQDLEQRLARMIIGRTLSGEPVTASDLEAHGAMAALLRDAVGVNLVQSLENNPVLVHGGPFANIAHGCSSVLATRTGLALADYVVTEAGFGADLGAEKFFNIKCRQAGLTPAAAVLVVTAASLKAHGGVALKDLAAEDVEAVRRGLPNLLHHMAILRRYGVPLVVAINRHHGRDSNAELAAIEAAVADAGAEAVVSDHWQHGGAGAAPLADAVAGLADAGGERFELLYPDGLAPLAKLERIATELYGADGIDPAPAVLAKLEELEGNGHASLPLCVAKTPTSLSADPRRRGVPEGFRIPIRQLRLAAGAGFLVALTGKVSTMPGLPKHSAVPDIHLDENGEIEGLR